VSDQGRVMAAMLGGAVVGGVVGYLYLTAGGQRLRGQIEPRLDDALREIGRLRQTIGKAQSVAAEGWRSLNQVAAPRSEWGGARQSSPY
jgi:hypothetical protein